MQRKQAALICLVFRHSRVEGKGARGQGPATSDQLGGQCSYEGNSLSVHPDFPRASWAFRVLEVEGRLGTTQSSLRPGADAVCSDPVKGCWRDAGQVVPQEFPPPGNT